MWLPGALASGASQLCPNHHYSWHNVSCYSLSGMPSPFPHVSRDLIYPERRRRRLLLLQGGLLVLSVHRVRLSVHAMEVVTCASPGGCYSLGCSTTLCSSHMSRKVPLTLPGEVCSVPTQVAIQRVIIELNVLFNQIWFYSTGVSKIRAWVVHHTDSRKNLCHKPKPFFLSK